MAPALCPFGSLPHAPKHWLWPLGMCWSPAMQKTASIWLVPFALGVETRCYAGLERRFLDMCKWARVDERKTAKSCTQTQKEWSFRSILSPTMQKTRCGYLFLVELGFTHKFSWKCVLRGVHDQHSLTQLDRILSITIVSTSITTHMSLSNSRALTWVCMSIVLLFKLG